MELSPVAVGGVVSVVAVALLSPPRRDRRTASAGAGRSRHRAPPRVSGDRHEPQWILGGVLPPLLYSAAINMPTTDFRRNLKPITGLAVLLVVVSTGIAGVLFHTLMPEIGWLAAFALAAVLSPTDAVAATGGRPAPRPALPASGHPLEGEGLVNDVTALVLLRSAVAAIGAGVTVDGDWRLHRPWSVRSGSACWSGS